MSMSKSKSKFPIVYPSSVPLLSPSEIGRGQAFRNDEPCCLIGWAIYIFLPPHCHRSASRFTLSDTPLEKALIKATRKVIAGCRLVQSLSDVIWCNDHDFSPRERAAVWAETMRILGYTEVYYVDE